MWRSLKHVFYSLWTYSDLSPDLRVRRNVNKALRLRPALSATEWHQKFWQPLNVPRQISDFVYTQMQQYSGLEFGRVQPHDRLNEDLHLHLVCWFDWELAFYQAFFDCFEIDLSAQFNLDTLTTVEEFVLHLNYQLLSVKRS